MGPIAPAGLLGLLIGSFLNVVIWRVPRGLSVLPRSACPHCAAPVRARDNVPVVSWLALRGRCRACRTPISVRYLVVEASTAALFAGAAALTGWSWTLPAALHLVAVGVALACIDLELRRLPDRVLGPASVVGVILLTLAAWNPGGPAQWTDLGRAGLGAGGLLAFYLVLVLVWPGGMGLGDVKLAGLLGGYLGWFGVGALVIGGFAAFLFGGAFAIGLLASGRARPGTGIPFGPWMLLGAAFGILAGEHLWAHYLALLNV
ncbi:prepilin peptidase [Xylanimonas ulmi]|uniref:Leader peptidase (Prepilin peptidase)/N-methyltransferase n=1 Tax=Xylanimonas ulmi TaxID=228973 RepID=A0A4Q7M651_9MICO|nr:A24 family peptidase [Xylanibacterium ulmi]RZS61529.1 leader peptidase (prepilin peptidase)/N-methyltransferase [Xylanibacterium ulmi]